jgi:uncharacterized membrane protein
MFTSRLSSVTSTSDSTDQSTYGEHRQVESGSWRKRFSILLNRLYLYPAPEPIPPTRQFWLAMGLVAVAAVLFSGFFIAYLTGLQDAYLTHAEDLGIMDQAIWNTVHGHILHQTICNILTDTNCYSPTGIVRFAIHFEPILFPISLLYLVAAGPKTLVIFQTLVVASGAFPAFWLARLRLRNEWAAVAIAVLYLLYPAQQEATFFDFHAVTLTASLLLFVLYFMYTRRTVWLFVFAILAMGCKEEIPAVLALYGLWSAIFQRRWRSGLALALLGVAWTGVGLLVMHLFSPVGYSLLAGRFASLGHSPLQIALNLLRHPKSDIKNYILEPNHLLYLHTLLAPTGFLALLAPWVLILAVPTLGLNMLSNDVQMYSGLFQYNAEIVPILIFATIEALVLVLWLVQMLLARCRLQQGGEVSLDNVVKNPLLMQRKARNRTPVYIVHPMLLTLLSAYLVMNVVRIDALRGHMPFSAGFRWPQVTAHDTLAQKFIAMIPPDASVSAQSGLVPHISQRTSIYMFPYATGLYKTKYQANDVLANYVFLDVTSDIYPYYSSYYYIHDVKLLMVNGNYGVVAAQDGYVLLKRGLTPPGLAPYSLTRPGGMDPAFVSPNLPAEFCSFVQTTHQHLRHLMQVNFTSPDDTAMDLSLIGYRMNAPNVFSKGAGYMTVVTYWQVNTPPAVPLQPVVLMIGSDGKPDVVSTDFPGALWCQTTNWQAGTIIRLTTRVFGLQDTHIPTGLAHLAIALVPMIQSSDTMAYVRQSLPAHVLNGSAQAITLQHINAVEVVPVTIVP